ncbi:MAG: hypothetical protein AAF624_04765 [Bacteroidota bacterium]
MGQQQLLLLVLGIVIVGLAVVVGISSFTENQEKSEIDRYTAIGVEMAGELIAWYKTPSAMGGGGEQTASLGAITIEDLGYTIDATQSTNYAGTDMTGTNEAGILKYVAQSSVHPYFHIHAMPRAVGMMRVEVHLFGPTPDCFVTRYGRWQTEGWSDGKAEGTAPDNPDATNCTW